MRRRIGKVHEARVYSRRFEIGCQRSNVEAAEEGSLEANICETQTHDNVPSAFAFALCSEMLTMDSSEVPIRGGLRDRGRAQA
jgi:hypothetical protein